MSDNTIRQAAGFIATEMGEGWKVDTSPRFADYRVVYIDGPDGARISIGPGGSNWNEPDKLRISGDYPEGWTDLYGIKSLDIGVSRFKDPAVIARDIKRRLLPEYLPMLLECQARLAERQRSFEDRAAIGARLAAVLPGLQVWGSHNADSPKRGRLELRSSYLKNGPRVEVEVQSAVDLKISGLSSEMAEQILAIVAREFTV